MRISKTLISGAVAAVAVAGSANAGVIDAFTVAGMSVDPQPGSPFNFRELGLGGTLGTGSSAAVVNTTNNTLSLTVDRSGGRTGNLSVSWANFLPDQITPTTGVNWTGLQSISFTIASTTAGTFSLTLASTDSSGNISGRRLTWGNFNVVQGTTNVVLNVGSIYNSSGSFAQETNFNVSDVNYVSLQVRGTGSYSGTISNFQYNVVPAPGALALVGAAGLVGGRRRRA